MTVSLQYNHLSKNIKHKLLYTILCLNKYANDYFKVSLLLFILHISYCIFVQI